MSANTDFTKVDPFREADFILSFQNGAVFIDFNRTPDNLIYLVRISFDGYGCCNLEKKIILGKETSKQFLGEMAKEGLDQNVITLIVKEAINENKDQIWIEALEEYGLV
jgi:hypothetical protein